MNWSSTLLMASALITAVSAAVHLRMIIREPGSRRLALVPAAFLAIAAFVAITAGAAADPPEACGHDLVHALSIFLFSVVFAIGVAAAAPRAARRRQIRETISTINSTLLGFGMNPRQNVGRLLGLARQLLDADIAIYYTLDGDSAEPVAFEGVPEGFALKPVPVSDFSPLARAGGEALYISNIHTKPNADRDPNIRRFGLRTFIGQPVVHAGETTGWLCLLYTGTPPFRRFEQEQLGIVGAAIGVEEDRWREKEELRQSQEKYERLYRGAGVGLHVCEAETGRITECNDRFARMHGYASRDDCIADLRFGESFYDPTVWGGIRATLREADDGVCVSEVKHRRKGGATFWVLSKSHLLPESGLIEGVSTDITARKDAEDSLLQERQMLDSIIELNPYGIAIYDPEGRYVRGNPAFAELFGSEPPPEYSLFEDPVLRELGHLPRIQAVLRGSVVVLPESWYDAQRAAPTKPSREVWIRVTLFPVSDTHGAVKNIIMMFENVSERRRAEEARSLLATAVEQAAEIVIITDTEGVVQYCNPAFEKITGYRAEEVVGETPKLLKSGHHDDEFYSDLWDTIKSGRVWSKVIVNRRKDGTLYEEEATISPIRDSAGGIVNFVAVKRDVTIESQVRQTHRLEALGRLAGGVAHDFNNLLTGIMGSTGLLQLDMEENDPLRTHVDEIAATASRAARLTRQLLAFSKTAAVSPEVMNLNDLLRNVGRLLGRLIGENVTVTVIPDASLWNVRVDAGQMEQIVVNLAVNARDAMPEGGSFIIETHNIVLDEDYSHQHRDVRPGRYVMVVFSDTGTGMSEEVRARVFEPFFTTKKDHGTGLGLATVYGIVRQSGGAIYCSSERGQGTTFSLYLPAVDDGVDSGGKQGESGGSYVGRETILLVEDDASILRNSEKILLRHGYTVIPAATGQGALDALKARSGSADLLLTDLVLPDMHGRAVAEAVRKLNQKIRIIYTSGYADQAAGGNGDVAADSFIQKPYQLSDLLKEVRRVLG